MISFNQGLEDENSPGQSLQVKIKMTPISHHQLAYCYKKYGQKYQHLVGKNKIFRIYRVGISRPLPY